MKRSSTTLERNRAHSLNRTATLVWRHCDGRTSVRTLARLLATELEIPPSEAMVWMALNRLAKARLLDVSPAPPGPSATYSRRAVMRTLGAVGKVALILPVVHSILTPLAVQAQSCMTKTDCEALTLCSGESICSPPAGKCCTQTAPSTCRSANCA